jgi:hypothetical protein
MLHFNKRYNNYSKLITPAKFYKFVDSTLLVNMDAMFRDEIDPSLIL